ncbi:MAG: hypothetical protein PHT44_03980 [Candidatus Portnoybacteria bacterium]|nr:hypothetical protein [Candidatus Portnoybacteria bacterium]MDD4983015.1 hypothetical protein [Candidatus Portnoybacteria bacterium]
MATDEKTIFKTMQALDRARLYAGYNKETNTVRVDSRKRDQMGYLGKQEFLSILQELENRKAIKTEDHPDEQNKGVQYHFQVKLLLLFNSLFKALAKKYPDLQDIPISNRVIKCGNLSFKPSIGEFRYGAVKDEIKPGTAPWSVLYFLMQNKNKFVTREQLSEAIMSGWIKTDLNLKKDKPLSDIESIIKIIRRKLKMGVVREAKNKNLIEGGGNGKSYGIFCR